MRVQQLTRGRIKSFLAGKLNEGLARNTVRLIHAPLRGMLNAALDDGIIMSNPAAKLGRQLRITSSASDREESKAMSRQELSKFLAAAREREPRWFALFFTAARTGLRLGELLSLRWEDFDHPNHTVRVARAVSRGVAKIPKSRKSRAVDMSRELETTLRDYEREKKVESLRIGKPVPPWVFASRTGNLLQPGRVEKVFKRIL